MGIAAADFLLALS